MHSGINEIQKFLTLTMSNRTSKNRSKKDAKLIAKNTDEIQTRQNPLPDQERGDEVVKNLLK